MPPDERPLPFGYGQNPKPNEKSKLAAVLFSLEGVLDAADGVLNLTLNLVSVAFRHQLGVADRLADHLLHGVPFICLADPMTRSLSIGVSSGAHSLNGSGSSCGLNGWSSLICINSTSPMTFAWT
jgi:hypothetical protein